MKKWFNKSLAALSLAAVFSLGTVVPVLAAPAAIKAMPSMPAAAKTMPSMPAEIEYTGYLIDANCGTKGFDAIHKIDLKKNPEKHTTECLKMKECMNSGLGISVKQADGTYKFIKFDAAGSKKADDAIMMMTKRTSNNEVTVKGKLNADILSVTSIQETNKLTETEYVGYLIDAYCGVKGFDEFHKIDLKKNSEKHLTECMKMDMCMKSGLGISVKQADGTYKFIKFDAAGSKKADDAIMMMTKRKFNNKIAVKGILNGDILTISSIREIQ